MRNSFKKEITKILYFQSILIVILRREQKIKIKKFSDSANRRKSEDKDV